MGPSQGQELGAPTPGRGKRILFASIGSLGDIHPCIALGLELRQRGHFVSFATTEHYRSSITRLGFGFHAVRPDWDPTSSELIARCEDLKRGPETLIRELILPHLNDTYEDLLAAARDADLILSGELNYAAPIVAEKLNLRWASIILSPISFFSAHDPSLLVNAPYLIRLRNSGVFVNRAIIEVSRTITRNWWEPVRALRRREGLRVGCDPLLRDKCSERLTLALFSKHFAEAQPDWPANTVQPGFVFYDRPATEQTLIEAVQRFVGATEGDPPIVFTQGSTATHNAGDFYDISAEAARQLGRRAVLVGASDEPKLLRPNVLAVPYAPYSWIFPQASVIVHQGGSGTTGQALRAGIPMLIVPYGWDQPDNALRVERLGAGLHLPRRGYSAQSAAKAIRKLIENSRFADRAAALGEEIRAEDALTTACDAIEGILN